MFIPLSLLLLAVGLSSLMGRIPWLTAAAVRDLVIDTAQEAAVIAINIWLWIRPRLRILAIAAVVYIVILIVAIMLGIPWLTFIVAMIGVAPACVSMYALYLVTLPLAAAKTKLQGLGNWLWTTIPASIALPASLNPSGATQPLNGAWRLITSIVILAVNAIYIPFGSLIKAVGGVVEGIGAIIEFAENVARRIARGLAVITVGLQTLAILALVDQTFGWHVVDPWVIGYLSLALPIYLALYVFQKDEGGVPGLMQVMAWLAYAGLGLLIASLYLTWTQFTQYAFMYVTYAPIAVCVAITLVVIKFSIAKIAGDDGHGNAVVEQTPLVRRLLGPVVVLFVTWALLYPWMTGSNAPYHWAQRLSHFQFWRLNNVNTRQTQKETDPLVEAAEKAGVVPSQRAIHTTFIPSADRARMLADEQEAWDAHASGSIPHDAAKIHSGDGDPTRLKYVDGPAWIRIAGRINGSGPAGIPKPGNYSDSRTFMEVAGDSTTPYLAALFYSCRKGSGCTPVHTIADHTLVCPGDANTGQMYGLFNERVEMAGQGTGRAFYYNAFKAEAYSFWLDKDDEAVAACAARTPSPATTLVAQR